MPSIAFKGFLKNLYSNYTPICQQGQQGVVVGTSEDVEKKKIKARKAKAKKEQKR